MQIGVFQQFPAYGFTGAALKQHVVRYHHRGLAGGFSIVRMCCTKLSCLLEVVAQKSWRL